MLTRYLFLIVFIKAYVVGTHLTHTRYLFPIVFIKAYVVGTHLNCLDLLRQFK